MAKIIQMLRRGAGRNRFEILVMPHLEHLYRLAYRFTGDQADAEDLIQDLMVKLYGQRERLEEMERLRPWLARVLYHLFIDGSRRRARTPEGFADGEAALEFHAADGGPSAEFETTRLQQRLSEALANLNPDQRALVALHDVEGYTLAELVAVLDTPIGTLKSRLHRARASLREQLEPPAHTVADLHRLEWETNP